MIKHKDLYSFIQSNFDFLLVVDKDQKISHISPLLLANCCAGSRPMTGIELDGLCTPQSVESLKIGMEDARQGNRGIAIFTPLVNPANSIPLKTGYADVTGGGIYLFFGSQIDGLSKLSDWEKNERIKELSCLYSVADWAEMSPSVEELFKGLPDIIARGMQYSDQAIVCSRYEGGEYGDKIKEHNHLYAKLVVNNQECGDIRVGYISNDLTLLPEEQKMLSEIARILSAALEHKLLSQRLLLKQEQDSTYRKRLADLETEIGIRTRELEDQSHKLKVVDSYLDRVNKGLEESKKRLDTMFRAIPDDVALIDLNHNLVITNRKNILPGDKCHKAFFNNNSPCHDCRLKRVIQEKVPITATIHHEDRYLEVNAVPFLGNEQQVEGVIEYYRDVTREKTYEQQLHQADKLASLGQLVSGIGHEINNPNQFIKGNIKIVRQMMDDVLPILDEYAKGRQGLKIARLDYDFFRKHIITLIDDMGHGSERIKNIVDSLRNFVRRDEGLLSDAVDINGLIESTTRLIHNEVHKHADIRLDLDRDMPVFPGNAQKIEQVLVNLIINARDAMPEDTKGVIIIRSRKEGANVIFEVEDNGRGMNEKTLKQVFDPFFTTKRSRGGTGLGLSIAYRIIEEHGGVISVKSKPEQGTTFRVEIPRSQTSTSKREIK
jgi:signal transduction histidine kinase